MPLRVSDRVACGRSAVDLCAGDEAAVGPARLPVPRWTARLKSGGLSRSAGCNTINTLPQKTNYYVHVGNVTRVT